MNNSCLNFVYSNEGGGSMDSNFIENLGIHAFNAKLIRIPGIVPHLYNNDRTPLYDGEIYLYDGDKYINDYYVGSVRVQVKSSTVEDNFKWGFKFRVNDLIKYMYDGGVMILAAYVHHQDHIEYFYRSLLPFEIRELIPENYSQKTIRIKVNPLPMERDDLRMMLYAFVSTSRQQVSLVPYPKLRLYELLEEFKDRWGGEGG